MTLHLFDTYARQVRPFTPLAPPQVRLYACGPTVYNYQHIGNLRTYIFEDILRRALEYSGYEVHHVVNITDVGHLTSDADTGEDKMEAGSRRTGLTAWEIAERYTADFQEKLDWLNILAPHVWCRATDHIREQIAAIAAIEGKRLCVPHRRRPVLRHLAPARLRPPRPSRHRRSARRPARRSRAEAPRHRLCAVEV